MTLIAVALLLGAAAPPVDSPSVTPARLPPVERCAGDAGFDRFRSALADAVTRKDVAALRRLSAPDVRGSFDGAGGWDEFASNWGLSQNSAMSALWKDMAAAIALGCAPTEGGGRVLPGMFADMGEDVDATELVVARPGTKLQSRPSASAPVIATLDWSSAIQVQSAAPEGWVRIQLLKGGPVGWVRGDSLLSPIGYRLVSQQRDGRWLLTAFLAGD